MINRSELVTAALLGTDRRPPNFLGEAGEHEPATSLLDHAARSAVALRAGVVLPRVPPPPSGPLDPMIMAPAVAQSIMSRLMARPVIELINVWLALAAIRGVGLEPALWSAVIVLAARRPDLDRALLAQVLGPRGLWFCEQNPQWQRLASALRRARTAPPAVPGSCRAAEPSRNRSSDLARGSRIRSWTRSPSCDSRSTRRSPIMIIRSRCRDPRSTAAARRAGVRRRAGRAGRGRTTGRDRRAGGCRPGRWSPT